MRLANLGHNEWVAVVDANFTAERLCQGRPVIRLPGHSLERVSKAILSVFPVCSDVPFPVGYMHASSADSGYRTPAQQAVVDLVGKEYGLSPSRVEAIERFAFYERVKNASLIVQSGEMSGYGNAIYCKDVIFQPTE